MTTKPTLGSNKAVGNTLGAAEWNLNVLQQGNWTQEVLAGTNADKIPGAALASPITIPGQVNLANDANFSLLISSGNPFLAFDSLDSFWYDRTANTFNWWIANVAKLQLDFNGKLTGAGFFRSGGVSITAGSTANFNTGFGVNAFPSFVYGYYHDGVTITKYPVDTHSDLIAGRSTVRVTKTQDASGNVVVKNDTATTYTVFIEAIL